MITTIILLIIFYLAYRKGRKMQKVKLVQYQADQKRMNEMDADLIVLQQKVNAVVKDADDVAWLEQHYGDQVREGGK